MNDDLHNVFQQNQIYYTDALVLIVSYGQLRHGDDGCAEVFHAPF